MKTLRRTSILLALLAFGSAAPAQAAAPARRQYRCVPLSRAPALDGEVDTDPAWRDVPAGRGYVDLRTGKPSVKQTVFRAGYTADALYVAVVCYDPQAGDLVADRADGDPLWTEDSVEVFLSPDNTAELQFAVNAIGSRTSPVTLRRWKADTKSSSPRRGKCWPTRVWLRSGWIFSARWICVTLARSTP